MKLLARISDAHGRMNRVSGDGLCHMRAVLRHA